MIFFIKPKERKTWEAIFRDAVRDKKIAEIGRFFGEKSDFGGPGKDFAVEKSDGKKSAKNRRFFLEKKISDFFPGSKNMKNLLLTGFEPTQNA